MSLTDRHLAVLLRIGKLIAFAGAVLGTTKLTLEFNTVTSASTAAFSFLIVVLLSAYFGDLVVAIATSFVATLCYDYFYLPPYGTFNITAFADWVSLAAFLLASVIISRLTTSAAENAARARALGKSLAHLQEFGEWLLSEPHLPLTFSGIARVVLRIFSLDYCSIHVYREGKWQHFSGVAASDDWAVTAARLNDLRDHATDLIDPADENMLGVRYVPINHGTTRLAVLAVKSKTLPAEVAETIACLIGVQLRSMINDEKSLT